MEHSTVTELRNAMGKLVAKWYPEKGVIEIVIKGCPCVIAVPPGTPIKCRSNMLLTK
ncbi:hypothetical protein AALA98_14620 [Lachnospiraceae bacterium 45-W7]